MGEMKSVPFSMVMPEDLHNQLEAAAEKGRCSKSYIVKQALYEVLPTLLAEQLEDGVLASRRVELRSKAKIPSKADLRIAKALEHMEEMMKALQGKDDEEAGTSPAASAARRS
jgi:predicted DNA-binding protein